MNVLKTVRKYFPGAFLNVACGVFVYFITLSVPLTVAVLVGVFPVIYLCYRLYHLVSVCTASGLTMAHRDEPDPTSLLRAHFGRSRFIRLLAIRGARMLGSDRSLMNYVIGELPKEWQGTIQVLLLSPDSEHLKRRALELKRDPKEFADECRASIQNLKNLAKRYNLPMYVRVYDRKPVLRTIIFDDRALISYYVGEEGHIPLQYEARDGTCSLLRMVNLMYEELWDNAKPVYPDRSITN